MRSSSSPKRRDRSELKRARTERDSSVRDRAASRLDGPSPKHVQLRERLMSLATEEIGPGGMIPSERELMSTYQVSRATVREAIGQLVADGRLTRVHGKGTYVARERVESNLHLASFTQDMRRRGHRPATHVREVRQDRPDAEVCDWLGIQPGQPAWRIERLRLADDEPMAHEIGWYSLGLLPDLDREDLNGSLYAIFESRYGLLVDHAVQTVWTEPADTEIARQLATPRRSPVMVFLRASSTNGRGLEHVVSRYRGDRYQIQMHLDRKDPT